MLIMNLGKLLSRIGLVLCPLSGAMSFAQPTAHVFDFGKINGIIAETLLGVYKTDPIVTDVTFALDPKTDLGADRFAAAASTTVQRSSWSSSPATLTTSLSGEASPGTTSRTIELGIQLSLHLKTESLPFIKYVTQLSETITRSCVSSAVTDPFERELAMFLCGQKQKILVAKDLIELREIFEGTQVEVEAIVQKFLSQVVQKLGSNPTALAAKSLSHHRKQLEETLDLVKAIKISVRKDVNGNEIGLEVKLENGYSYQSFSLRRIGLIVEQDHSELALAFSVNDYEKSQFIQFKALAANYLMALEAKEPEVLQTIAGFAEVYMNMVKEITRGPKQSP